MFITYADITGRIDQEPVWWLEGVPRYDPFSPREVGVYANEAALVLIEGQYPEGRFEIGLYAPSWRFRLGLRAALSAFGFLDIGDPPNYRGRASPVATASARRILQYWRRDESEWERVSALEVQLESEEDDRSLLPDHRALAVAREGDAWRVALDARDVPALRRMLAAVGCEHAHEAARFLALEAMEAEQHRQLNRLWTAA